ncbi:MAG: hypothetical protein C4555_04145 [Dehalococcoidia bacterium]|nr:MAG: hypothetical protein C4555_04145 [Dehalococcoidia bacterium]
MNKLVEALKTCGSPQPMGFKSARETAARPRLLLIASTDAADSQLAENTKGANALLVTSELKETQIKGVAKAAAEIPWGCALANQPEDRLASVIQAGADFVTFTQDTPLKTLPERETERVLEISTDAAEKLPRAVNDSQADVVYLITAQGSEPLTWRHLLLIRALSAWLSKPLLVSVPDTASESELQALWDAGAAGVVASALPGNIARLRKAVDGLKYPAKHKTEERTPVIPSVGFSTAEPDEEDEDW